MVYDSEEVNSELFKLAEENVDFQRALELQYTKDLYTEAYLQNQADLSYQLNPKNQAAINTEYNKVKQELIAQSTNSENLSTNKEKLVEDENITKEDGTSVGNDLDKKALEEEVKEQKLVATQLGEQTLESRSDDKSDSEEDFEPVELTEQQNDFIKNLITRNQNQSVEKNDDIEDDKDLHSKIANLSGIELKDDKGNIIQFSQGLEGLAEREKKVAETYLSAGRNAALSDFFKQNPDLKSIYDYKQRTGSIENFSSYSDYSTIKITDETPVDVLKDIYKKYLTSIGKGLIILTLNSKLYIYKFGVKYSIKIVKN